MIPLPPDVELPGEPAMPSPLESPFRASGAVAPVSGGSGPERIGPDPLESGAWDVNGGKGEGRERRGQEIRTVSLFHGKGAGALAPHFHPRTSTPPPFLSSVSTITGIARSPPLPPRCEPAPPDQGPSGPPNGRRSTRLEVNGREGGGGGGVGPPPPAPTKTAAPPGRGARRPPPPRLPPPGGAGGGGAPPPPPPPPGPLPGATASPLLSSPSPPEDPTSPRNPPPRPPPP